jgi:hypothetical protein
MPKTYWKRSGGNSQVGYDCASDRTLKFAPSCPATVYHAVESDRKRDV